MDSRDNKGGRCDIANSKGLANTLNENCLSCTEWAVKKDEIARNAFSTNAHSKVMHIGGCSYLHWLRIVDTRKEEGPRSPEALLT
jgi:hypothetical protein